MKSIEEIKLNIDSTIHQALQIINKGAMQIALVVDSNNRLIGTVSDGDIRRALLKRIDLDSSIEPVVFRTPTVAKISNTKEEILKLHQIPIVDDAGKIVGIQEIEELIKPKEKTNKVVLMVGTRLRPLTENTPKPMLKVGNKPILQTIVEYGYINIVMCVNYKSHIIQDYFGDGSEFGVNIEYIFEEQRMEH